MMQRTKADRKRLKTATAAIVEHGKVAGKRGKKGEEDLFDLWATKGEEEDPLKKYFLTSTGQIGAKRRTKVGRKKKDGPAVEVEHRGLSYNPKESDLMVSWS